MAVLGHEIFEKHGPYIWFCVVDSAFKEEEPYRHLCKESIFIQFSEDLLNYYCAMTRSYSPFDPYEFIQLNTPHKIYEFTAKLLSWESQLARTPLNYFWLEQGFNLSDSYLKGGKYTDDQLKADLLETLHFMVGEMHKAAASGKCVIIAGI